MTYLIGLMVLILVLGNEGSRALFLALLDFCIDITMWVVVAIGLFGVAAWALSVI
jgi:hypothetical protein